MAFTPHTDEDVKLMLEAIGADSLEDLFRDVPAKLLKTSNVELPAHTEYETDRYFAARAAENDTVEPAKSFLGAGAYQHYIPAAVKALISRGEFMTCYTPYQAEVSQGTLQAIYEFQSHICALTGMDVANASMYDGATALAEALTMAVRQTRRNIVAVPELLHPAWRNVVDTFLKEIDVEVRTIPANGARTNYDSVPDEKLAAVVLMTPNMFGAIEDGNAARESATKSGGLLIAACNPTSLAILTPPGDYGADIVVGEAQPLGLPLSFGGPYCGYFACTQKLIRKMPGRIVGKTVDTKGKEGFVLTLQTREQHIRRDKATSNICTNQGLFALMATMYMTFIGKEGLVEVAESSLANTAGLVQQLVDDGLATLFDDSVPFFHEAAIRLPVSATEFCRLMKKDAGIIAGFPLQDWVSDDQLLLVNCTELHDDQAITDYVQAATSIISTLKNNEQQTLAATGGA